MKTTIKVLSLFVIAVAMGACGKSKSGDGSGGGIKGDNNNKTNFSHSYCFNDNGCLTGRVVTYTPEDACNALQDDSLNGGCALEMRERMFEERGCADKKLPSSYQKKVDHDKSATCDKKE